MSNPLMQVCTRSEKGITYSDPTMPECTVVVKTTRGKKKIQGNVLTNYVTEVILNDTIPLTVNGITNTDTVSFRVRMSSDKESMWRMKELARALITQLDDWLNQNVVLGFELREPPACIPRKGNASVTVPSNPT